ncbi:MAG: hypothetical protein ACXACH_02295, partial [Candidatus Hermodarchaeia archaeon]|jgi:hypothetical protein
MFDVNRFRLDQIPIQSHDSCPVCGQDAKLDKPEDDAKLEITELCTEETFLVHSNNPIPINIPRATEILRDQYPIIAQSSLGVQIHYAKGVEVSIVGEGNILIKGVDTSKSAEKIYHQILTAINDALIV